MKIKFHRPYKYRGINPIRCPAVYPATGVCRYGYVDCNHSIIHTKYWCKVAEVKPMKKCPKKCMPVS